MGSLFGSEWSFLLSSIRGYRSLVGIYSFRKPVCHGRKWIFKPVSIYGIIARRFPVCYFLSVNLSESRSIFAFGTSSRSSNSFPVTLTQFGLFCYVDFVPVFCDKIVLIPWDPVIGWYSCNLPLVTGWNFFVFFTMSYFVSVLSRFIFVPPSFTRTFFHFFELFLLLQLLCCFFLFVLTFFVFFSISDFLQSFTGSLPKT